MEENKNITVNGVEFTPEMLAELKRWSIGTLDDNEPLYFMEVLSNVQDFLCKRFSEFDDSDIIKYNENADLISGVMHIKAALKVFTTLKS